MKLPPTLRVIERGWLSSNNILAFDGDAATLVDSGYVGHAAQTVALLGDALAGRQLTRLINTHSHSDHLGGNAAVKRAFGCSITIPAGIEESVTQWDEEALLLTPAGQASERFVHDAVIHPNDAFVMGGLGWRALPAPGHDMHALVFYCEEARLLISGDALWEDGFGIIFAEILGQHLGQGQGLKTTRNTLEMIGRLELGAVIPGHGPAFGGATVAAALRRAEKRLAAFEQDPGRMAKNAVKACFIFNLLDRQSLPLAELESYVASVPFFVDVGARVLGLPVDQLARWLHDDLLKSGAIAVDSRSGLMTPTRAA